MILEPRPISLPTDTIDGVELDVVAGNVSLNRTRQSLVQLVQIPTAVQQEGTAGLQSSSHVILVHIRGVVAGYEVSLLNQVGALIGFLPNLR